MDFSLTAEQIALENECAQFAKDEITPHLATLEENIDFRKALFAKMAKKGWFSLTVPKTGGRTDPIAYALALKAIAKADAGMIVAMGVTNMVAETIVRFGNEEQKRKYLPGFNEGKWAPSAFALTEKMAGSDVKNLKMTATVDKDDSNYFVLEGEKQFISNADIAGLILVVARTNADEVTAFLFENGAKGFSVTKTERKLGMLTANLVDLKFDRCRIPKGNILGKPGEGLKIALSALDSGRIGIAAQSLGIAEAAYEAALQFSRQREQFGQPIGANQAIAFKLADMKVRLEAGYLMLMKACWLKSQGKPFSVEASTAKLYCSEAANEIAGEALHIHGGYGYVKDYPAEKYFRDARVTTIYEGTSEIQRIIISRHILK